jgi:hypothetical protein
MPLDLSNKSAVILDHGAFTCLAERLARDFGTVYYVDESWQASQSRIAHAITGSGLAKNIIRVPEIFDVLDKCDVAIFPDVHHAALQLHIEKLGMPVWGARRAENLEIKKLAFKKLQQWLGMKFAEYDVIQGIDALREYCQNPDKKDRWVKCTPQFRGDKETFHFDDYEDARKHIDEMSLYFEAVGALIRFIAEKSIDSEIEGGLDTYTVDGQHPKVAVQGFEKKDMCYFAAVQKYEDIPKEITCVADFLWPEFKKYRCRQMFSTEVKVTESGDSFLLEPTVRFPSPAGEEQMELYENFSEIIYEGAQGRLVEPVLTAKYACEAMVEHTGNKDNFRSLIVPESVRQWVKLYGPVGCGKRIACAPGSECIGAVVGIGDTPTEALEHLKTNAEGLKGQPVTIHIPEIAGILQEIEEAEKQGMHFTDDKLPQPDTVLT